MAETKSGRTRVKSSRSDGTRSSPAPVKRTARKTARPRASALPASVASAVKAALDKKAEDLVVLDLRQAGGFTDYFVICTGRNARQVMAIADAVTGTLKEELGERPSLSEGAKTSEWILLDYFNFVVHVFSRECRAFYALERLWGAADRVVIPGVTETPAGGTSPS